MSFKAEIIGQTWQGPHTKSLTARIGTGLSGGIYRATGLGEYHEYDKSTDNTFGFNGAWRTGLPLNDQAGTVNFVTDNLAQELAIATKTRGFGSLDTAIIASASLAINAEELVLQKLRHDHGIMVGEVFRHSVACNGGALALTQAGQEDVGTRVAVGAIEHLSPFLNHNSTLAGLFGDGIFTAAVKPGHDLSVLATNTLFEFDDRSILRIPHGSTHTLVPSWQREPFDKNFLQGTCQIVGPQGHVFMQAGGVHQPLQASDGEYFEGQMPHGESTMNGSALAKYFGRAPIPVIKQTLEQLTQPQIAELNVYGVIHQPSEQVFTLLSRKLASAQIANMPNHVWVAGLPGVELGHNNVSAATIGFALLNQVDRGQITKPNILFTGLGVGHNVTSTVFRFGGR